MSNTSPNSLQVVNVRFYRDLEFSDYLKMPGYSFSWLKSGGQKIEPTPKMQLGTKVHAYLLSSHEYSHSEGHDLVRPLAVALKGILAPGGAGEGGILRYCTPELAVTADFVYQGMVLHYKGRIDLPVLHYKSRLCVVIDIKVTEMDLRKSIDFFKYDVQVSGYSLVIGASRAVIVSVNPKSKLTQVVPIRLTDDFWKWAVLKYGQPIK